VPTNFPPTPRSLDRGGHGARRAFAHPTISADRAVVAAVKANCFHHASSSRNNQRAVISCSCFQADGQPACSKPLNYFNAIIAERRTALKQNLLAERQLHSDVA
jgi:hypothetical protein